MAHPQPHQPRGRMMVIRVLLSSSLSGSVPSLVEEASNWDCLISPLVLGVFMKHWCVLRKEAPQIPGLLKAMHHSPVPPSTPYGTPEGQLTRGLWSLVLVCKGQISA